MRATFDAEAEAELEPLIDEAREASERPADGLERRTDEDNRVP
jgi:hypothetical protein